MICPETPPAWRSTTPCRKVSVRTRLLWRRLVRHGRWDLGALANGPSISCDLLCDADVLPGGQTPIATAVADQPFTNPAMAGDQVHLITGTPPAIPVGGPAGIALHALCSPWLALSSCAGPEGSEVHKGRVTQAPSSRRLPVRRSLTMAQNQRF